MLAAMKPKEDKKEVEKTPKHEAVEEFRKEAERYKEASKKVHKKGTSREEQVLVLTHRFYFLNRQI